MPAGRLGGVPSPASHPHLRPAASVSIVLASGSPRRRELLAGLGLAFEVRPADIDESALSGESAEAYVARLAADKAAAVAEELRGVASDDGPLIIAADTVVVCDGELLGKPRDAAENAAFLDRLAGRTHQVLTGHCLLKDGRREAVVRATDVTFRALSAGEKRRYVDTGEGFDKAGGYAIQGIGASLVDRIDGCYFNVVGLSVPAVVAAARRLGVALV